MSVLDTYIDEGFVIHEAKLTPKADEPPRIRAISAADLAEKEFAPLVAPVHGLIVEGLTLLVGASKIGKSWLMLQLCNAVANGKLFIGHETTAGSVLYCAFEDSQRRLQDRMARQGIAPSPSLYYETQSITLENGLIQALEGWTQDHHNANLIVIDTLQKVRGMPSGRANLYAEDYAVASKLKAFADEHHVAVVCTHHLNKLRDVDDPFDRVSGSTGLMGAADTTILMQRKRGEDDAHITYTGRDVWGDDFDIRFENCRWTSLDPAVLMRERYDNSPVVKAIKLFVAQATFDGTWAASYEDFKKFAADRGLFAGVNGRDVHRSLDAVREQLAANDGIDIATDKRVGKGLGFRISKR